MAAALIILLLFGVLITISGILRGWVLTYLWEWFVMPFGLPELGLAHAIGIAVIVSFLTYQYDANSDKGDLGRAMGTIFLAPFITLFIGWVIHSFM